MISTSDYNNEKRYFYCYNARLRKYLDQNGTRWVGKGVSKTTGKPYWKFERTARLGRLLEEYKILNPHSISSMI